jgi:hypothetical protein
MSRYEEIPELRLDYNQEWSDLTSDAVDAYFEVSKFAIHEVARSERWKAIAVLGWSMAMAVWLPLLWSIFAGGQS